MSSQDVIVDSGSRRSRLKGRSMNLNLFSFEHSGGLKDRLLTALIVLSVALALSLLAIYLPYGRLLCVVWAMTVVVVSIFEVVRLFARNNDTLAYRPLHAIIVYTVLVLPGLAAASVAATSVFGYAIDWTLLYLSLLVAGVGLVIVQVFEGRTQLDNASRFAERYGVAFLLLGVCAPQLIVLSALPNGVQLVWWLAGVVALNDTSAYFAGRAFGRHTMAPALSPKKTVEGMLTGLVVGALAGVVLWRFLLGDGVSTGKLVFISLLATLAAQAADLSKSYLKRLRGVKDTGAFFPGHGGILDRFDGMIGAAPVVLVALALLGGL